jgi:hypothetical protein
MKKSNLLLLVGFLTIVVLISAIHITLYAKYKAGNYTIYNEEEELAAEAMQTFPNIAFVSVQNVPIVNVKFSDVAKVGKADNEDLQYTRTGDTLVIGVKVGVDRDHIDLHEIHVPNNVTLSAFNSTLSFIPGKKITGSNSVIYLKKSRVFFTSAEGPFQLGNIKIVATDSSSAFFRDNTQVNQLDVQLTQSAIEYKDGDFGQMSIVTDSLSRISLQSKHLLKANIKTIAPQ